MIKLNLMILDNNSIHKVIKNRNKIDVFLSKNVVQAQEYVYKTQRLKNVFFLIKII